MAPPHGDPARRQQASELVATRFTRVMNAATSPHGMMADLSVASLLSALPLVMLVRQAAGSDGLRSPTTVLLVVLILLPPAISVGVGLSLRGARERVIDWMAQQPFAIENLNSLLAGISDEIEIHFAKGATVPSRQALQKLLDPISEDTLATAVDDQSAFASVKIGVIDDRLLPLRSNHQRYVRFQRIVEQALTSLHRAHPIATVRVV